MLWLIFDCQRSLSNWNLLPNTGCLWWWLCCCQHCASLVQNIWWCQEELICVINNEVDDLWQKLMSFTRKSLISWLRTMNASLKEKLLSNLAFCKNVCITLFMSFSIGGCVYDGFLTCWWYRWKHQELKFASNFCHTMRMKKMNFFKILRQLTKCGCIIMNMKPSISPLQSFTCITENSKPRLGKEKSRLQFWKVGGLFTQTTLKMGPSSTIVVYCNTQNFETTITRSSEAQNNSAAAW